MKAKRVNKLLRISIIFYLFEIIISKAYCQNNFTSSQIFQYCAPSVVLIEGNNTIGSGFFLTNYTIITNSHVINKNLDNYKIIFSYKNNKSSIKKLIARDTLNDIAVFEIEESGIPLKLSNTEMRNGNRVYSIGNPMGLKSIISEGLYSGEYLIEGVERMQFSAPISPGSSGGPILNEKGEVVGINVASIKNGQSLNFGVPLNSICNFLRQNKILTNCNPNKNITELELYKLKNNKNNQYIGLFSYDNKLETAIINIHKSNTFYTGFLNIYKNIYFPEIKLEITYPIKTGDKIKIMDNFFEINN